MSISRFNLLNAAAFALLTFLSSAVFSQEMTAEEYIAMDIQARQVTLDGVRDRLALLQQNASLDAQLDQDMDTQEQVEAVFAEWGFTSSHAIAWATKNAQDISDLLIQRSDFQADYDRLASELNAVSEQIQALASQE